MWKYFPRAIYVEKRRIVQAMKYVAVLAAAAPTNTREAPPRTCSRVGT